jgi:imidazolonepropionase-like amidohydrolase
MKQLIKYICVIILLPICGNAQQITKSEAGIFLLKGGELELLDAGRIKADLLIQDGIIKDIAENIQHPGAETIDISGHVVYPGMIDGGTRMGLAEIGSISLTQDHNEIGDFTPQMRALTAVNPNSVNIPVNRVNGITTCLSVPTGGRFPGKACLIDLHGYTPEQMFTGFEGVVFNFPSTGRRGRWDRRSDDDIKKADKKARKSIEDFWEKAVLHARISGAAKELGENHKYNPQLDAMIPVINGETPLLVEVNKKSDILGAIEWIKEKEVKAIFTGVAEGYLLADSLAKYKIPVVTGPVLSNPSRDSDHYATAYSNASVMQKAGVQVAIRTNEAENVRNLSYNAGFAATYGMGWKEAFKAVSIVPARIFGIDDKYGSLERGKVANLFVADGDPFETKTQIKYLFIQGFKVPLESRHTYLYDEFLEREPGVSK